MDGRVCAAYIIDCTEWNLNKYIFRVRHISYHKTLGVVFIEKESIIESVGQFHFFFLGIKLKT